MENISHNAEKNSALGDKLSKIRLGIQNDKYSKLEKIDEALKSTRDKLIDFNEDNTNKFQAIKEQLSKLFNQIEDQNNMVDQSYDEKMQYLHALEEKVVARFENEDRMRKEMERKTLLLIEERYTFLINELLLENFQKNFQLINNY